MEDIRMYIDKLPIFKGLTKKEKNMLAAVLQWRYMPEKEIVFNL